MLQANELIPSPWDISPLGDVTVEELMYLGSETLQRLIDKWVDAQYWVTVELQATQEAEAFLRGKSQATLIEIAKRHERVQFHEKLKTSELYHMSPNPLLTGRARGSTTCNTCGWCAYARRGTGDSMPIELKCTFYELADLHEWLRFDDDCRLTLLTDDELLTLVHRIRLNRQALETQVDLMDQRIERLREIAIGVERKPMLDGCEPDDWFSAGDQVFVLVRSRFLFVPYRHFVAGSIQAVEDRKVIVQLNKNWRGSRIVTLPTARPELLKVWEFEYLRSHVDFARRWLQYFDRTGDFKIPVYMRALR